MLWPLLLMFIQPAMYGLCMTQKNAVSLAEALFILHYRISTCFLSVSFTFTYMNITLNTLCHSFYLCLSPFPDGKLSFIYLFKLFYYCSISVCIYFPPLPPTSAKPISLSCFHSPPWFCSCVLYSSS